MSTSTFDSTKEHLVDLLKRASEGSTQLPDFQRGWVWDDEHVRDLLTSVSRSFPIGAVMMLQSGSEVTFKTRMLEGVTIRGVEPKELVLDGQQGLTSLYQALSRPRPRRIRRRSQSTGGTTSTSRWRWTHGWIGRTPSCLSKDRVRRTKSPGTAVARPDVTRPM